MQIERLGLPTETHDDLSAEEVMRKMHDAMNDQRVTKVTVTPRYVVQHEGPNRRARRNMKFGRPNEEGSEENKK